MAHSAPASGHTSGQHEGGGTRRDFLYLATGAMAVAGVAAAAWPFINQMNPAADVLALSTIEVNISRSRSARRSP